MAPFGPEGPNAHSGEARMAPWKASKLSNSTFGRSRHWRDLEGWSKAKFLAIIAVAIFEAAGIDAVA